MNRHELNHKIEVIKKSGLFDECYYLDENPDVKAKGINPLLHYVVFGAKEYRNPSPYFITSYYLNQNPDVAASTFNPLEHYAIHGKFEGRSTTPFPIFDLMREPDLKMALSPSKVPYSARGIQIVYHIGAIGDWKAIVEEQLELLSTSGLGEAAENIFVTVSGMDIQYASCLIDTTFSGYSFTKKMKFEFFSSLATFEFPSIRKVQEIASQNPLSKIFYFHTKGSSYSLRFKGEHLENLMQWRKELDQFNISKWQDCLHALDTVDIAGINWGNPHNSPRPNFFAGNYWWANAQYINRCILHTENRWDCENFIGTGNPTVRDFKGK